MQIQIDNVERKYVQAGFYSAAEIARIFNTSLEPIPTDEELEAMYKQAAASDEGEAIFDSEKGGVVWESE